MSGLHEYLAQVRREQEQQPQQQSAVSHPPRCPFDLGEKVEIVDSPTVPELAGLLASVLEYDPSTGLCLVEAESRPGSVSLPFHYLRRPRAVPAEAPSAPTAPAPEPAPARVSAPVTNARGDWGSNPRSDWGAKDGGGSNSRGDWGSRAAAGTKGGGDAGNSSGEGPAVFAPRKGGGGSGGRYVPPSQRREGGGAGGGGGKGEKGRGSWSLRGGGYEASSTAPAPKQGGCSLADRMSGTLNAPLQPALEKRDEAGTGTSWRAGVMSQAAGTSHLDPSWKLPQGEELRCSKVLAWILRHGGVRAGYKMTADGFVRVDEILSKARELHQDRTLTEGNVRWMVAHNDKQRFRLKEHEGNLWVAASQGHSESLGLGNAHLTPVTDARKHPSVCHGTYYDVVDKILAEGLRPMSRQHVHFCDGDPGDGARIRGLRKSAEILVFVDVGKCIADGMEFFVAANGVLLSPGNADRRIPAKYFRAVLEASSRSAYNPDARW